MVRFFLYKQSCVLVAPWVAERYSCSAPTSPRSHMSFISSTYLRSRDVIVISLQQKWCALYVTSLRETESDCHVR